MRMTQVQPFWGIIIITDKQELLRGEVNPYGYLPFRCGHRHWPLIIIGQNCTAADQDQKQQDLKLKTMFRFMIGGPAFFVLCRFQIIQAIYRAVCHED